MDDSSECGISFSVITDKENPPPLEGFSYANNSENELFIFGGYNYECSKMANNLYRFRMGLECFPSWRCLTSAANPRSRCRCKMVADEADASLYIYGGAVFAENSKFNKKSPVTEGCYAKNEIFCTKDMWKYNIDNNEWSEISYFGGAEIPTCLTDYTLTKISKFLILFGGIEKTDQDSRAVYCNKLHMFDLNSQRWIVTNTNGGIAPNPRRLHSSVNIRDKFLAIYGGQNEEDWELDDLHVLDLERNVWLTALISDCGDAPCPRYGHVLSVVKDNKTKKLNLLIHGGSSELDPGSNIPQNVLTDSFVLDFDSLIANCRISEEERKEIDCDFVQKCCIKCDDCFDC